MIWAKEETLSRTEIEEIQTQKLRKTVAYVYDKVPYYRAKMEQAGLKPADIQTLGDLCRLPFTTKSDMRDTYPFGMFAVPKNELVRIHASSGTTGKPTVVGYTQNDLNMWSECVARIAALGGATKDDVCQICFGYGMFTGALGLHYGLEKWARRLSRRQPATRRNRLCLCVILAQPCWLPRRLMRCALVKLPWKWGLTPVKT